MLSIRYQQLTPDYRERAKEFMMNIIEHEFGYSFNPEWHWDVARVEDVYLLDRSAFFVALYGEEVVGTIALRPYDKQFPQFVSRYNIQTTGSCWRHYVKKEYRGKGIGKQLYGLAEQTAREKGFSLLYLHTQKTISGSLEYWAARGFTIVEEVDDEFSTVHMEKRIQ